MKHLRSLMKFGQQQILADGASFTACDANTAITLTASGTLTTSTNIDVLLSYVVDA